MVIYIAGKITGNETKYKAVFDKAQKRLEEEGHIVINPSFLPVGMAQYKYMPICLSMLDAADAICLLYGWEESKGACLEKQYAEYQNKLIIMEVSGDGKRTKPNSK